MCEKPSSPSRACSGFVNTELKRASLPWVFTQTPAWRGVPFFSGNHVDITPMGLKETPSSRVLVVNEEELQLWHCQECSIFCSLSTSFWWVWPRALICCLQTQEKFTLSSRQEWDIKALAVRFLGCLMDTDFNVLANMKSYTITQHSTWKSQKYWDSIAETQLLQFKPTNALNSIKITIILQHTSSYMFQDSTSPSAGDIQLYKTAA